MCSSAILLSRILLLIIINFALKFIIIFNLDMQLIFIVVLDTNIVILDL